MKLVVSGLIATLVTLPIISYVIFFIVAKQLTKNHRRAVRMAMDLSTVFFIFSVNYLIMAIWNKHLFWLIMVFILTIACSVVLVHYKVNQEIVFEKVLKGFWRLNFVCFFGMYVLLCFIGIITRIFTSMTV